MQDNHSPVKPAEHEHEPSSEAPHHPACARSFDARDWARDFRATAKSLGYCDMDEGWLIGWFANAIMRGFDESERRRDAEHEQAAQDTFTVMLNKGQELAYERGLAEGARAERERIIEGITRRLRVFADDGHTLSGAVVLTQLQGVLHDISRAAQDEPCGFVDDCERSCPLPKGHLGAHRL